jgi:hypothetical protein
MGIIFAIYYTLLDFIMYFKAKVNHCNFKHTVVKLMTSNCIDSEMIFPCISLTIHYTNECIICFIYLHDELLV